MLRCLGRCRGGRCREKDVAMPWEVVDEDAAGRRHALFLGEARRQLLWRDCASLHSVRGALRDDALLFFIAGGEVLPRIEERMSGACG